MRRPLNSAPAPAPTSPEPILEKTPNLVAHATADEPLKANGQAVDLEIRGEDRRIRGIQEWVDVVDKLGSEIAGLEEDLAFNKESMNSLSVRMEMDSRSVSDDCREELLRLVEENYHLTKRIIEARRTQMSARDSADRLRA